MPGDSRPFRPNVIVFFTDQQRWDSTGLHGNPLGLTPNFDRLAHEGTHVAHSFTSQPVCGPARSCFQTGQYATTTGVWQNGGSLRPGARTLAGCFNDAGYRTGYIGKWHLAPHEEAGPVAPERRGGYTDWLAANLLEFTSDAYRTRLWNEDREPVDLPGYRVDALTDAAIRYVDGRAKANEPFFLFLSHLEPHHQNHVDDYPAPAGYRDRYTGRWTPPDLAALPTHPEAPDHHHGAVGGTSAAHLGGYWGMVKRLDEALGRLVDALKSLEIDRETILLFTSDHGCHFKTRNGEYKRSCHESAIRVPTMLAGPGFEGGGALPHLVSLVDLAPTLVEAAGLEVPETMQGRSILPLVRRDRAAAEAWPEEVFVQISESHTGRAVRTRRWKYAVAAPGPSREGSDRYAEAFLYDLDSDPHELTNLVHAESHAPVRAVMRQRLLRRMREAGEPEPVIEPAESRPSGQRVVSEAEARS